MNCAARYLLTGLASALTVTVGSAMIAAAEPDSITRSQSLVPPAENGEFPFFDDLAWDIQRKGLAMKLASRLRVEQPGSPVTVQLLLALFRYQEAMEVLRHIVQNHPDRIAAALVPLPGRPFLSEGEHSRTFPLPDFATALSELIAEVLDRLPHMPQEEAVRIARAMLRLADDLARVGTRDLATKLKNFIAEHAVNADALLDDVSRLASARPSPESLNALDEFARNHPGTVAGARALYEVGINLKYNGAQVGFEPIRGDPTERFIRLLQTVRELEAGQYPPCEWVEKAPDLVLSFAFFEATFAAGNAQRMLRAYEKFLLTHIHLLRQHWHENPLISFLADKKYGLLHLAGEGVAGIDRIFKNLEAQSDRPGEIQLLKARFYIDLMREASGDERTPLLEKARETLLVTPKQSEGLRKRLALATLASLHFHERDYADALQTYRQYVKLYPKADWAWVAALRIGQCHEALNDLGAAANAFRAAAERYRSVPVAAVLGNAYASDANEALGRVDDALREARRALKAWDNDYGQSYYFRAIQARRETDEPFAIIGKSADVSKYSLPARIGRLQRASAVPDGALAVRGAWLVKNERWNDAIGPLSEFVRKHARKALSSEARSLLAQARLGRALELANVENPKADPAAALRVLDGAAAEPDDFAGCAVRIAEATIKLGQGNTDEARKIIGAALKQCLARQTFPPPPTAGSLEADVLAIRDLVFRPKGDGVFRDSKWGAFSLATQRTPYLVANSEVPVRLPNGEMVLASVRRPVPGIENVLFLNPDQIRMLERTIVSLGGTRRRTPANLMAVPNQPIGPSLAVRAFWNEFIPAEPGHWSGWVFQTYPILGQLIFLDEARTRAKVDVTIGSEGGSVVLEKADGKWRAKGIVSRWIT